MESIYRLKKRMVYPEKLALDQISSKTAVSRGSWCNEPIEQNDTNMINGDIEVVNVQSFISANNDESEPESSALSARSSAVFANKQFIQDRVRHLVDAFSTRTQKTRARIQLPPTPSSISSRETTPNASASRSRKITDTSERWWDDPSPPDRPAYTGNVLAYALDIYETTVIDPQGKTYIAWMSIAALAVLYNVWVIPLRSSFPYQTPSNRAVWMFFDYLADAIYIADVFLLQPRIMYVSEGFAVSDYKHTRDNYLKKLNFKMDLLSLLPLDLLYIYFGPEMVILRLPRFFKLHTFWAFFNRVDKLIASPHIIRITRTLLYMMYLIHINACAYYAFSVWEGIGSNNFVYNGKRSAYIVCFYFATKTATSIGKNPKPTKEVEFMFMTCSWLMGVFVFALLIGQIRDIIATATRSQTECRKLLDETLEYMRRLNLPQDMQRRVKLWFNYTWEAQRTLDEETILDCLPHKTKTDIAINVHITTLSKVNLFADCDEALLRELVLQLKSVTYLPGDIICKKGDVGKQMYIVQSGKVRVIGRSEDEVLATLSEGSVFGEISLLGIAGMNRRTADVKSYGYSNIFVLSKSDLNEALRHYPEAQDLLNKKAKQLMKQNAELERRNKAMIVIDNPTNPDPPPKLLETVLQVVPQNSNVNRLLRYGSRGYANSSKPKKKLKTRHSIAVLPLNDLKKTDSENTFQTKVTVHRSLS